MFLKEPMQHHSVELEAPSPMSPAPEKAGPMRGDELAQGLIPPGYRSGPLDFPHSIAGFLCRWPTQATLCFLMLSHRKVNFQGGKPVKIFLKKMSKTAALSILALSVQSCDLCMSLSPWVAYSLKVAEHRI